MPVELVRFDPGALATAVSKAARNQNAGEVDQVRYLATYLGHPEISAKTMVVESPYVDRHYAQEFAGYYATTFHTPPAHATRLHFFDRVLEEEEWNERFGASTLASQDIDESYLGYVVVRPIPNCPIGRTALVAFPGRDGRVYEAARTEHRVHLCGMTLNVEALPFQQQDRGLGACATTALWSAISRTARADGGRTPTPLDVARAARSGINRASEGLDVGEMQSALRAMGFEASVFKPTNQDLFLSSLKACIRAGMAPILLLRIEDGDLHAVTVAGMREADTDDGAYQIGRANKTAGVRKLTRLYLHDDRFGPYARADLTRELRGEAPHLVVRFDPQHDGFEEFEKPALIQTAIVPLYAKIRLRPEDLIELAAELVPSVAQLSKMKTIGLRLEPSFQLGGRYLATLGTLLDSSPIRLAAIRRNAHLSRYVGVARFFAQQQWLADFVFDTTDVNRGLSDVPRLLITGPDRVLGGLQHAFGAESVR